ncbi:MAG: sensor histidine kinase [Candidatus Pristimantibacillus sp.]
MSIRRRLYLSYMAMVVVPFIAITAFVLLIFYTIGMEDVRDYMKEEGNVGYLQSFVIGEMDYVLRNEPSKIENPDYMQELGEKMGAAKSGFIIIHDNEVQTVSSYLDKVAHNEDWLKLSSSPSAKVTFNQYRFEMRTLDFKYEDGSQGRALWLARYDSVPIYWRPIFFIVMLIFTGLTSMLLTYFVSRSIIKPIQSLKTSALYMKEGDLTHPVKATTKGELGQLSITLEEMRVRLKQSIDQSLQYEENRKMLLSHISHDLKTPIAAIKGYVEGIHDGIANTDEMRDRYMSTIYRKTSDMDRLIDELFLFSKLDMQKVAFDFKVIDLHRYLHHFLEEQKFDMEKADINLIFPEEQSADTPLLIAADPEKLGRVLTNILNNSVKYMGQLPNVSNHTITVTVEARERDVVIALEDTGPGIDAEDLPYIFDGFYRAEQSRNSETGGSGLGLAIVKQIIEGHGGQVWAEEVTYGGSRFCLLLPRSESARLVDDHEKHSNY